MRTHQEPKFLQKLFKNPFLTALLIVPILQDKNGKVYKLIWLCRYTNCRVYKSEKKLNKFEEFLTSFDIQNMIVSEFGLNIIKR